MISELLYLWYSGQCVPDDIVAPTCALLSRLQRVDILPAAVTICRFVDKAQKVVCIKQSQFSDIVAS